MKRKIELVTLKPTCCLDVLYERPIVSYATSLVVPERFTLELQEDTVLEVVFCTEAHSFVN
jgi:hypothetical protein